MRWLQIARKDFDDARRERQLYFLLGLFGVIAAGVGYFLGSNSADAPTEALPFALLSVFGILVPIAALTITQGNIVGKRATGELSVLLSLPFSRRAIVLGGYVGRLAVSTVALAAAFVVATLLATVMGAPLDAILLGEVFLLIWAIAVVFTAIALGLSALTRSTTLAAGGSFGVFLLFVLQLWRVIPVGLRYLFNGLSMPSGSRPEWAAAFVQVSPFAALRNLANPLSPEVLGAFPLSPGSVGESVPWYQEPLFAGIVVLAWILVPLVVGYLRFQRNDL